jgi:hypothetical protein
MSEHIRKVVGLAVLVVAMTALASGLWTAPDGRAPWFVAGLNFGLLAAYVGFDAVGRANGRSRP